MGLCKYDSGFEEQLDRLTITELVEAVLEKTGYVDILNAQATLESKARVENIEEFLSVTKISTTILRVKKRKLAWINLVVS